jgi:hypothetical protein
LKRVRSRKEQLLADADEAVRSVLLEVLRHQKLAKAAAGAPNNKKGSKGNRNGNGSEGGAVEAANCKDAAGQEPLGPLLEAGMALHPDVARHLWQGYHRHYGTAAEADTALSTFLAALMRSAPPPPPPSFSPSLFHVFALCFAAGMAWHVHTKR